MEILGIGISAVLAFVANIVSFGIHIPGDLQAFNLLAAAGAMAGLPTGRAVAKGVERQLHRVLLIFLALAICIAALLAYLFMVQRGSVDAIHIVLLAIFLTITFCSFTFLMAMAGVALMKD